MARYYFDIYNCPQSIHDDEGSEFDSLDVAMQAAACSATEIETSLLAKGDTRDVVIEAVTVPTRWFCSSLTSMTIEQHVSRPRGSHSWSA